MYNHIKLILITLFLFICVSINAQSFIFNDVEFTSYYKYGPKTIQKNINEMLGARVVLEFYDNYVRVSSSNFSYVLRKISDEEYKLIDEQKGSLVLKLSKIFAYVYSGKLYGYDRNNNLTTIAHFKRE